MSRDKPPAANQELPDVAKDNPSAAKWFYEDKRIEIKVVDVENATRWWIKVVDDSAAEEAKELESLQAAMAGHYSGLPLQIDYK